MIVIQLLCDMESFSRVVAEPLHAHQLLTRHGDTEVHSLSCCLAQSLDLSLWHEVHGFGMPDCSVSSGDMKRNVCAAT
jgi:hypothetical protein